MRELARLVVPVACPCGVPDVVWCAACARTLAGAPLRVEAGAPRLDRVDGAAPLPVWGLAPYAGPLRDVVVHWKDRGRADLDHLLAPAAGRLGSTVALALPPGRVLVVPVPSSGAARRARGREPVRVLARAATAGLRSEGADARLAGVLRRSGPARDQVGLGSRARGRNLAAAVRVSRPGRARLAGAWCLLVDDVLTTGATLAASETALERAGGRVLGAIVLAATPPPDTPIRNTQD